MKPGTRPKPTKIKRLEGNPGQRPLPANEPEAHGAPVCPDWLDADARIEWDRIIDAYGHIEYLTAGHQAALAVYCQTWSDYKRYCGIVAQYHELTKTTKGEVVVSPYVGLRNKASQALRQYAAELGFTPSSQTRCVAGSGQPEDEFSAFLSERKQA